MSLGWQSESALLPSKATPINVDSKSMMSMKALVYNIEQKLSSKAAGLDARSHSRKNPRHAKSSVEKTTAKESLSSNTKNPSMKKHSRADTQEDDETNIKVAASLRAKAALYDQIAEGKGGGQQHQNSQLQNSIASSGSGAFLINFDEKRKADSNCDSSDFNDWKAPRYETDDDRNYGSQETFNVTSGSSSSRSDRHPERYVSIGMKRTLHVLSPQLLHYINYRCIFRYST
jgi:hypothetical protein